MTEKSQQPEVMEFDHDGKKVVGRRIDVVGRSEPTCTFSLSDGAVLSLRLLLIDVYKLEGVTNSEGRPVYRYSTQLNSHVWPKADPHAS